VTGSVGFGVFSLEGQPPRPGFHVGSGILDLPANAFGWRERKASPAKVSHARRELLHSIGSCSFFEPVEELEALGVLPR